MLEIRGLIKRVPVSFFVCALLFIYPLGALLPILCEIYNRKKYAFVLLSVFMGLCAILFPPFADLYRHNLNYFNFSHEYSTFEIVTSNGLDFLLHTISNTFSDLNINFELIRFLFAFTSYQISFYLFRNIVSKNRELSENQKIYFISFLCVFLSVPFIWIVNGLRYTLAASFLLMALYRMFFIRKYNWWIWMVLAAISHFGILPIVFVALLLYYLRSFRINPIFAFLFSAIFAVIGMNLLLSIIDILPLEGSVKIIVNVYIKGNEGFTDSRSFMGLLANIIERTPLIPFLLFYRREDNPKIDNIYLAFVVLIGVSFPVMVLYDRVTLVAMQFFLFCFLYLYRNTRLKKNMCQLLLLCYLISNIGYLYGYREPLFYGRTYKLMYSSMPAILCNNYDINWIRKNLDSDGEFKKY